MTPAVDRWRSQLADWALPADLLAAVPDSPYGWPAALWRRRTEAAAAREEVTPTLLRVETVSGPDGSVLDVGAGTGRASLPLARRGHRVTAVEPNPEMLAGLRRYASGLPVQVVEGAWPEVAGRIDAHTVTMSAHVVYDVADIGPFLRAMHEHGSRGTVIELTDSHPWTHLSPYYRALHGLDRPAGPTAADLAEAVTEVTGLEAHQDRWTRPPDLWFESVKEVVELYGRRLVLPRSRWDELEELLAPDLVEEAGRFRVEGGERVLVTLWWTR